LFRPRLRPLRRRPAPCGTSRRVPAGQFGQRAVLVYARTVQRIVGLGWFRTGPSQPVDRHAARRSTDQPLSITRGRAAKFRVGPPTRLATSRGTSVPQYPQYPRLSRAGAELTRPAAGGLSSSPLLSRPQQGAHPDFDGTPDFDTGCHRALRRGPPAEPRAAFVPSAVVPRNRTTAPLALRHEYPGRRLPF
jgi:hypothetical protein